MKATPVKVQLILTNMCANLTRMINQWERSGNGDGGMWDTEENPDFGLLDNQTPAALHNQATFLPGSKNSYLLIFWDLSDSHQLLASSLQRLDKSVGASDASSVPVVRYFLIHQLVQCRKQA
jgi:hypothetical protein